MLLIYHTCGSVCANVRVELTWFHLHRRVLLRHQSRIESCRGRSTDLNRVAKRPPLPSFRRPQRKFGAEKPATIIKATYSALKLIAVIFRMASVAWNLKLPSLLSRTREALSRRDGISKQRPEFSNEPTQMERIMQPFRCQRSLMGSHNLIDGTVT